MAWINHFSSTSNVIPAFSASRALSYVPRSWGVALVVPGSRCSNLRVVQVKRASTVPFADGAYGGACSVTIPRRSTSTCVARAAGKDLPPIMKNDRWFAVTRPGMLAFVQGHQTILRLEALFDESHVVFFIEAINRQNGPEDRGSFDADEHRSMHPARDHRSILCDYQLVQGMLIDLADMCRIGDREDEGGCRHPFSRRIFQARTSFCNLSGLRNGTQEILDLPVGRCLDWRALPLA